MLQSLTHYYISAKERAFLIVGRLPARRIERITCSLSLPGIIRAVAFRRILRHCLLMAIPSLFLIGCASGPQTRVVVRDIFSLKAVVDKSEQTKGRVSIKDMGELSRIVPRVRVQACEGSFLKFRKVKVKTKKDKKEKPRIKRRPVFEMVNPIQDLYIRELKIRNDAEHILYLNLVEAVLVDAAGNDNAGMAGEQLRRFWRANRPCSSTRHVIKSLWGLKFLGNNIRILPGRVVRVLAAFPRIDKRILGDWTLEIHGLPVETDQVGKASRISSFAFPLISRGYRTTIEMRKEELFAPWREINRKTEEIRPGF